MCKHVPCGNSITTTWAANPIENRHSLQRRKDCMKNFYNSLRKQETDIIDFEKKEIPKDLKVHQGANVHYNICGKRFMQRFAKDKKQRKVRDHCHYMEVQHIVYAIEI